MSHPLPTNPARFAPEVELLLCCAHSCPDAAQQKQIRWLVQQPLDWRYFCRVAVRNRVAGLCYRNLHSIGADRAPAALLAELKVIYQKSSFNNLKLTHQLVTLLDRLAQHKIPTIVYKGPALAQTLYGDLALRQFGDLDILIHEPAIGKVKELLGQEGFVQVWPELPLTQAQEVRHLQTKYNYAFAHPQQGVRIEVHWDITPSYLHCPPNRGALWRRLETRTLAGRQILQFPPEEHLLILCIHGANHCWNRLIWICDIAELIRRYPSLDWRYVLQLAHDWKAERMLLLGLYLAQTLLEAAVPPSVAQQITADNVAVALAIESQQWLFSDQWLPFKPLEEPCYHLRMRERWQDRVRYGLTMLVPSVADRAALPLPPSIAFLYYILRPFRLLAEHGIKLSAPSYTHGQHRK